MKIKNIFLGLIFFATSSICTADDGISISPKLSLMSGYTHMQIDTKNSSITKKASKEYAQIETRLILNYFVTLKWAFEGYYFQTNLFEDYNSTGYGIGGRYYLKGIGSIRKTDLGNVDVMELPKYNLYFSISYKKQSVEASSLDLKFSGYEIGFGAEKNLHEDWQIGLNSYLGKLFSGSIRELTSFGVTFGVNKIF